MTNSTLTRRGLLGAAMGAGSSLAIMGTSTPLGAAAARLNLDDPVERAKIRAKIVGSAVEEDVHALYKLHVYGYLNKDNTIPLFSMTNYTVTKWRPVENGNFKTLHYESGVYTTFNTDDYIEEWENPVTGEKREVWQFRFGPIPADVGPDGTITGEIATVHPESQGTPIIGDTIFLPSQSSFKFPNPLQPDEWPKESAGAIFHWDSFSTHSALAEDVANPDLMNVTSHGQFQNLVSWHPWLGMSQTPGRTFGRAYGSKLPNGVDDLPNHARAALERHVPEIFDIENWTKSFDDFSEFKEARQPT